MFSSRRKRKYTQTVSKRSPRPPRSAHNRINPFQLLNQLKNSPMAAPSAVAPPKEEIDVISIDDSPTRQEATRAELVNSIELKMKNFMESGNFISSDEDEPENKPKRRNISTVFISDDDSDVELNNALKSNDNKDLDKPSSSGTSSWQAPHKTDKNDSIMDFVDSVLSEENDDESTTHIESMKRVTDYMKETEDLIKITSSMLDTFKEGPKPPPEVNYDKEERACPICLESLSDRPTAVTLCGHIYCEDCIKNAARVTKKCPTCRKPITVKKIHPIFL